LAPAAAGLIEYAQKHQNELLPSGDRGELLRILVTGAAGFVGTAVVRCLLSSGYQVAALAHATQPAGIPDLRSGDILDPGSLSEAVAGVDAVCHLAARTRVRESFLDPVTYFKVNVTGTLNLLDAMDAETARTGRPLRLLLASTGAVYGVPARQPISEDEPPAPVNPYGASKLAAEAAAAYQAATGKIGSIVLRAFNIAGAVSGRGDSDLSRIIPKTLAVAAGRFSQLHVNGDGTAVREYLHVEDFAKACALAVEACDPGTSRTYNVGSGTGTTVRDIISMTEKITQRPVPVSWGPAQPEPRILLADSSRIVADLGWNPRRSDLATIVSDAWQASLRC
jgi:UDP-glucose 4-epimerase